MAFLDPEQLTAEDHAAIYAALPMESLRLLAETTANLDSGQISEQRAADVFWEIVADALAGEFMAVLVEWLPLDAIYEIRRRNALPSYDGCCASHDFCDANVAMDAAFVRLLGRDADLDSPYDALLWAMGWDIARDADDMLGGSDG